MGYKPPFDASDLSTVDPCIPILLTSQLPQSKSVLYIDHPVEHPTPSGSRAPSPSGITEPISVPGNKTANGEDSPLRVPTQAIADSPPDEKPAPLQAQTQTQAKTSATALDEIRNGAELNGGSITPPAELADNSKGAAAAIVNGQSGALDLGPGSPTVPHVHSEAHEYYGGKEIVNRSRTYSIVSVSISL